MADSTSISAFTHPTFPSPFNNTSPPPTLITQGAEAHVYRTTFLTPDMHAALKVRPSKPYRHPTLDARLTKQRVLAEARILAKLVSLPGGEVKVPRVLGVDWDLSRGTGSGGPSRGEGGAGAWLLMEWVEGRSVKDLLREWDAVQKRSEASGGSDGAGEREEDVRKLLRRVGRAVGAMHSKGGVVHGDLTSSNIMVRPIAEQRTNGGVDHVEGDGREKEKEVVNLEGEIVLIDFGLATQSVQDEDRAVDLYVLERAFGSTHPRQENWFKDEVLDSQDGYKGSFKGSNVVLKRLEEVRMRGRKRTMVG
jgi:TP53 regulating kinase and related kinases